MDLNGKTEICIVGGGPAGSAAAIRLAALGYRVCVIEGEAFPRAHIGESLSPGILPLLDFLGVRAEIEEAGFYRPRRAFVQWGSKDVFVKDFEGQAGFQVDRGRFDRILLRAAEKAGARVIQPAFASHPVRTADGKWQVAVRHAGRLQYITADFLVDAAGRRSFLKKKARKYSPRTLALYGYWKNAGLSGVESRVETGPAEWYWGAPLPDGTFNAAVFVDPARLRQEIVRPSNLKKFYCSLLAETVQLETCLKGDLLGGVHACDASIYRSEDIVDDNSIRIGEASYGIDPLSSQGVQLAVQSAIQASIVIHTLLTEPGNREAAIKFYEGQQEESVAANLQYAGGFYAEAMPFRSSGFWSKRAVVAATVPQPRGVPSRPLSMLSRLRLSNEARMIMTPCITGDIISERPALVSPTLKRPAAFIGGVPADSLYSSISSGKTVAEVVRENDTEYPGISTFNIINWLFNQQVLVASDEPGS